MKHLILIVTPIFFLIVAGCAHRHTLVRSVTDPDFPEGVAVSIGSPEVKEGDLVRVYRETCKTQNRGENKSVAGRCDRTFIGDAKVVKLMGPKRAMVQPQTDFVLDATMVVEKE